MNPPRRAERHALRRSRALAHATFALTLAWASAWLPADPAVAAEAAGAGIDGAGVEQRRSADAIRYRVVVDAPKDFVETLTQSVDLVRWQSYADMTDDLLDRLVAQAEAQAREAASTIGYFTPNVDIAVGAAAAGRSIFP
jgi:hypothetical protein